MIKLTEDQIERARRLRNSGMTYVAIASRFGCGEQLIRVSLDPAYRAVRNERAKVARRAERAEAKDRKSSTDIVIEMRNAFKADAAARLAEIPKDTRDLTARIAGDPLPGRSALDMRLSHG